MQLTVIPVQTVLNITADISRIARCSSITVGVTFPQYCAKLTFLYLRKHVAQPHLVSTLSNMLTRPTIDRAATLAVLLALSDRRSVTYCGEWSQ